MVFVDFFVVFVVKVGILNSCLDVNKRNLLEENVTLCLATNVGNFLQRSEQEATSVPQVLLERHIFR